MNHYVVIFGAFLGIFGGLAYIRDTLRGVTKPNRMTWLMWGVAPLIGAIASFAAGVTWAVLPVFILGLMPLFVFGASFVNPAAYWKLTSFDYVCGVFSVLALVLWGITREPVVAIIFAILSDVSALVPTLIKAWKHPETESGLAYILGGITSATSFSAIPVYYFAAYAFPGYLVIASLLMVFAIFRHKLFRL